MITGTKWGFVVYITTLTCNGTWYAQVVGKSSGTSLENLGFSN